MIGSSTTSGEKIGLLDVGGGAGLILDAVSIYLEQSHGVEVTRFALDLSQGMLQIQRERNPGLETALNEDVRSTSLADKEIDLTLMIDVLEHVPRPEDALRELRRISKFVIFKVPLDRNVLFTTWDFIKRGELRRYSLQTSGHVNVYSLRELKWQIETNTGSVLSAYFTNRFRYGLNSRCSLDRMKARSRLLYSAANCTFTLSPRLCSLVFGDFVMILVKCY